VENKKKKKINNDLAIVASQIPRGAIHDKMSRMQGKVGEEDVGYEQGKEGNKAMPSL